MLSAKPGRDHRLDVIRGLAILTIALNHFSWLTRLLGRDGMDVPTLTKLMYSSSAELFFMLSGYLIGRLYIPAEQPLDMLKASKRVIDRGITLFIYNGILFLILGAIVAGCSAAVMEVLHYARFADRPLHSLYEFLSFGWRPELLDVLQYYFVFLLLAPAFFLVVRSAPRTAAAVVVAVYATVQVLLSIDQTTMTSTEAGGWAFNPFAWQALFYGGVLAGRFRAFDHFAAFLERHPGLLPAALALFVGFAFLKSLDGRLGEMLGLHFDLPAVDRRHLGPIRILNAIVVLMTTFAVLTRWPRLMSVAPMKAVATVGAVSLQSFSASLVFNYLFTKWWFDLGASQAAYWTLSVATVLALLAYSMAYRAWSRLGSSGKAQPSAPLATVRG